MVPVAAGLALGVAAALAVGRMLGSFLFEVRARDPFTIAVVSALLVAVAIAACFMPARRAARVEPTTALRYE
jgi:putative ABC transport system permease protein